MLSAVELASAGSRRIERDDSEWSLEECAGDASKTRVASVSRSRAWNCYFQCQSEIDYRKQPQTLTACTSASQRVSKRLFRFCGLPT